MACCKASFTSDMQSIVRKHQTVAFAVTKYSLKPVGHVAIERAAITMRLNFIKAQAQKMLHVGVSEAVVRQAAQSKGVDYDELLQQESKAETDELVVSIGALVVYPNGVAASNY
jgi:hypothetical protein